MRKKFKSITDSIILLSVLAILIGIIMIVFPGVSLTAFGIIVAAYLLVHGITLISLDIRMRHLYIPFEGFLQGVLCIILGILLAVHPAGIGIYIGFIMGTWVIMTGFGGIKLAAALKNTGAPRILMIIMNILDIIIGCLILYSPILSSLSLTVGLGIVLIVHSVINIINMITAKKNVKEIEKMIVEKIR